MDAGLRRSFTGNKGVGADVPCALDEILKPVRMTLDAAIKLIRTRKIRDAKTIAGLLIHHGQRR